MSPMPRKGKQGSNSDGKVNRQDQTVKASRTLTSAGSLYAPNSRHENKTKKKRKLFCCGLFSWKRRREKCVLTKSQERREKEDQKKLATIDEGEESDALDRQFQNHASKTPKRLIIGAKSPTLKKSSARQRLRPGSKVTGRQKKTYLRGRDLQRESKTQRRTNRYPSYGNTPSSVSPGNDLRITKPLKMVTKTKRKTNRKANLTSPYNSEMETFSGHTRDSAQEKKEGGRGLKCCMCLCSILAALAFAWTINAFSEEIYYSVVIIPTWETLRVSLISSALLWVCACFTLSCLSSGAPLRAELLWAFILALFNMSLVYVTRHFSPDLDRFKEIAGWWLISLLTPLLLVTCFTCVMTMCKI